MSDASRVGSHTHHPMADQPYVAAMRRLLLTWLHEIFREAMTPDGTSDLTRVRCWPPCPSQGEGLGRIFLMERLVEMLTREARVIDSDTSSREEWTQAVDGLVSDLRSRA